MPRQGNVITHIKVEKISEFDFKELCEICDISSDFLSELIEYGIVEPVGVTRETWRFGPDQLHVVLTALHLHQDLEINHAGIALAIDLMNQLERMRGQVDILEKHVSLKLRGLS